MPSMVALRRSRLSEHIAESLEARISSGEFAPGSELPSERELMADYGVGRPAVREALFHLQRMGLVEIRSGTRARVAKPSPEALVSTLAGSARYLISAPDGMRHFQQARLFFETGLARDAARLATAEDIARLEKALEANFESIGNIRAFEQTDMKFHYAIATIPQNPIYPAMHAAITEWLYDQRHVTLSVPGQNRVAFDAHAAIFQAIADRNGDRAAELMGSHLAQVADLYWRVLEANQ